ncbi:hypothetical protein IQ06DRAFT_59339 [Phaeosphaeriaceae sp. SRC1lsM3a]|nr:hypothetical protein IQ06DRAFT_59339 [Stagonospora sp. SRC1lsM3a]
MRHTLRRSHSSDSPVVLSNSQPLPGGTEHDHPHPCASQCNAEHLHHRPTTCVSVPAASPIPQASQPPSPPSPRLKLGIILAARGREPCLYGNKQKEKLVIVLSFEDSNGG